MRTAILMMIAILLTGCRSKKVTTLKSTQIEQIQQSSSTKVESKIEKAEDIQILKKYEALDQKKENQTDLEVKGKAETDKPIEIYNIENGDTVQAIRVNGNADVHVRTKAYHSDYVRKENASESLIEKFKEFSDNIVSENNIKNRVQEVKQKTKEIKTEGFQAGTWIFLAAIGISLIIIFFTYKYFKK